jgi:DNA-binding LacI/PurR family transcriptional regulator
VSGRGGERVTLQTLADALGVSRTTVSNAFNRPDQLNPKLRKRVLDLAGQLGYAGPSPAGRALRSGRAGAIGVLMTEGLSYAFGDPAAVRILRGLAMEAEDVDLSLVLLPASTSSRGGPSPSAVRGSLVDAFFVYSVPEDHPSVAAALERHRPVVIADTPRLPGIPFVGIDDRQGARDIATHVVELGHRHFGIAAFRLRADDHRGAVDAARRRAVTYRVTRERLEGYREALEAAGIDWDDVPIHEVHPNSRAGGREAAHELFAYEPRPTAVLALSDELAFGVLDAAREARIAVPGELSVAGFDDVPDARLIDPPLTTVRQSLLEKGRAAGRMLLEALDGREPRDTVMPVELVVRGSTGPPPGG